MTGRLRTTIASCMAAATLALTCMALPGCGQAVSTDSTSQDASSEQAVAFSEKEFPVVNNEG